MARYKNINGVRIQFTAEEETLRDAEEAQAAIEQAAYDAKKYQRDRTKEYKELKEQLDLLYHDMVADKGDKTGEWFKHIKAVKDANPKE
jgi:hypothetical protein